MMLVKQLIRHLHISKPCFAVEKALLAKLRKKTGYTFSNCKKALEMHGNDLSKAETWLNDQAQQLGWAKATKLEGRRAIQGIIAVTVNNNKGALIELNCETDFVARNEIFQNMAEIAALTVLKYAEKQHINNPVTKIGLDMDQLKQLNADDGKSLGDHVALIIGKLGENATLRRALCLTTTADLYISGYTHPSGLQRNNILLGKIGGLVAFRQHTNKDVDLNLVGKNICQHIVGMNPKKIGTQSDEPSKNADEEICLIHQEYLLDETLMMKDVLDENGVEVIDFKRFECGETSVLLEQPLDLVETCYCMD